jgi:hypothetical protein
MTLKTRCIVEGVSTARVWFMSGQVSREFLKMNPILFITPLTKMLQKRPVTVAITATPFPEFIHFSTLIIKSANKKVNYSHPLISGLPIC